MYHELRVTCVRLVVLLAVLCLVILVATHPRYVPPTPECNTTVAPSTCPTQGP